MTANEPSSPVCYAEAVTAQADDLKILILGAGAIGGYLGGRLIEAGSRPDFLVRAPSLHRLREGGLRIHSPLGDVCVQPRLVSRVEERDGYDVVVLACKAFDLAAAIEAVAPAVADRTCVLPLLNGLAHLEVLDRRFGRERVMGGFAHMAAERRADGSIHHLNRFHRFVFGPRHPGQRTLARQLRDQLARTSLEIECADPIAPALWSKFVFLATLAGATCLFRGSVGDILHSAGGEDFMLALLEECVAVASAAGCPPAAETLADYRALLTDREADYSASMLRDVEAGRPTEADHILGDMLRRAERHGTERERLRLACSHLQVYERRRARD